MSTIDPATALRTRSNSAIAMAFGMAVQSKPGTVVHGALAIIADEMRRRGIYDDLMRELGTERARAVSLQIAVDRTRLRTASRRR